MRLSCARGATSQIMQPFFFSIYESLLMHLQSRRVWILLLLVYFILITLYIDKKLCLHKL